MISDMPEGWHGVRLADFLAIRRGHDLPKRSRSPGKVPVVGASGRVGFHDVAKVSGPSFTIGRAANIGQLVWEQEDFWPLNTTLYVTDAYGNDIRFAFYLLHTVDFSRYDSGSVQPMLNRNYVAGHPLVIPEVGEQRAVAEVLGALDDRLVHLENRQRCMTEVADALFERLMESISDRARLGDWIELEKGTSYSSEDLVEPGEGRPLLNLGNFGRGRIARWEKTKYYAGEVRARHEAPPGTVVICATDMTSDRVVLGKALQVPMDITNAVVTLDLFIVRPLEEDPYRQLATLLALNHEPLRRQMAEYANGTTVLRVPRDAVLRLELPDPPAEERQTFVAQVTSLLEGVRAAQLESETVREIREVLLPELVSGRIRIGDLDGFLERAGLAA